ncbi:ATP-binding protein [Lysobacter sp. A3-1-A15]|uniref:ATP-binding protein n=2 Tax=Novilysobacter viscosus TaxID=3098602 RepID=UPI003983B7B1
MAPAGLLRAASIAALAWGVALLWALWLPAHAAVGLTPAERDWLRTAPEVVVAVQSDYPPFSFTDKDADGAAAGYSNELFALAAKKTGLRYRFDRGRSWLDIQQRAQRGQVDVLTNLWRTPERERYLQFVEPPYLEHGLAWAVRATDPSPPNGARTRGKVIAIARGFAVNAPLRARYPDALYVEVDSAEAGMRLVSLGNADAYVDNIGLINYLAARRGFANVTVHETLELPATGYLMAVTGDQPMLHAVLGKGLAAVTEPERRQLEQRWLQRSPPLWQALRPYLPRSLLALLVVALVLGWLWRSNRRLQSEVALRRGFEVAARQRTVELEQRQAFQQSLLDVAQAAVMVLDGEGRWIIFNRFAEQLLGWRADEVLGRVVRAPGRASEPDSAPLLIDPEQTRRTLAQIEGMVGHRVEADWRTLYLLATLNRPPQQVDMLHKDGSRVPVVMSLAHAEDADGNPAGLIAIANDMSYQKRLEQDLRDSQLRAEDANRAKSSFLAAMSHEIRTPMIGITGMVEILGHTRLDAEQRHALEIMQSSTQALLGVLGDILDFSRIEADRIDLHPAATDLAGLVDTTVSSFAGAASSKGLTLSCELDPGMAPAYRVDPLRFRQILSNFLTNAIKFTAHGGVLVTLGRVDGDSPDSDGIDLRVVDTGVGIAPAQRERLFQPFVQGDGHTTRRHGGSGLGLAICRRLAELMGGSVALLSSDANGSTFQLRLDLPRAALAEDGADPAQAGGAAAFAARPMPSVADAEAGRSLVLLVDDHPTNRLVIARQLALAGYASESATDGGQGLARWASGRYALLLTDIHMPGMDGYEMTRRIRQAEAERGLPRTPVVALTASALKGESERCLAAGIDDYLAKPAGVAALASTLARWLPHTAPLVAAVDPPTVVAPAGATATDGAPAPAALEPGVLQSLLGNDPEAMRAVLEDFMQSLADDLLELDKAVAAQDLHGIARQAHRIKGAALSVGAGELSRSAAALEAAARAAREWAGFDRSLLGLGPVVAKLRNAVGELETGER